MNYDMAFETIQPQPLNNNGGEANPLPILELDEIDLSKWKLVHDDRVMMEARSQAAQTLRARKAMPAKKETADERDAAKKSMRNLMSEIL